METISRTIPIRRPYQLPFESNKWGGAYFDRVNGYVNVSGTSYNPVPGYTFIITFLPSIDVFRRRPYDFQNSVSTMFYGNAGTSPSDLVWYVGNGTFFGAGQLTLGVIEFGKINSLAVTSNGTTGILYKNGNQIDTQVAVASPINLSFIGAYVSFTSNFYFGNVYEFMVFKTVLTRPQIDSIRLGINIPTQFDCVLWNDYRLGHALDLSGNGHNGILNGNVRFV